MATTTFRGWCLTEAAARLTIEVALEFALNRPTGEDDSYQGSALAGSLPIRTPPRIPAVICLLL
jgi:hypothetical protein